MAIQMTVVNTVLVCGTVYWLYKIVSTETSVDETLVHDHLIEGCCEVCGLIFKSFLT